MILSYPSSVKTVALQTGVYRSYQYYDSASHPTARRKHMLIVDAAAEMVGNIEDPLRPYNGLRSKR